jgi:hypothetical protein
MQKRLIRSLAGDDVSDQVPNQLPGEAVPSSEQTADASYVPRPEVEALTPRTPETLPLDSEQPGAPGIGSGPIDYGDESVPVVSAAPAKTDGVGGMMDQVRVRSLVDPSEMPIVPRAPSSELFKPQPDQTPNEEIVKQFVTPQRLRDLWHQMDALQEDVIQGVRADRSGTDAYQKDLLYASSLLLQSAGNYDEAREIVYRIRGDLLREKRVTDSVRRYVPLLLVYYAIWLVVLIVATRLDPQFRQMIPDNLPIIKLAFPPILFGGLGALFNGVMAIIDHTTRRRDFDPLYTSWYLINPLSGALLGLVTFVLFVVTGTSFTPNLITDQSIANAQTPLAIWLLAFIVGWQQNTAVRLLNSFLKTVSPDDKTTAQVERPATPSSGSSNQP